MQKKLNLSALIVSLVISLGIGGLAALLTNDNMEIYSALIQPPAAPPSVVFPIVWTILFILMGISSYMIYVSGDKRSTSALVIYGIQLILNFLWTIIFFNMQNYLVAFVCLVLLWAFILAMVILFRKIRNAAGLLQIPYLLWVTFAGYLNLAIYILNRS